MIVESIPSAASFPPFTIPAQWRPAEAARGAILLVPAMGTPARYYEPFAAACAARGFHMLLPDLPGTGASRPRPSRGADYGYADLAGRYLPPLVEEVRRRAGALPLVVAGHSLGAHVAMLATLQNRISAAALVTLAGGDIHHRNWRGNGAGRVLLMAWIVTGLSHWPGAVPGQYLGLGGPQARTLMREWSGIIRGGSFERVAGKLLRGPVLPSLCIAFEGDFMAPRTSVAALADLLGADLRRLPVDWPGKPHASWARHPHATLRVVEDWLEEQGLVARFRGNANEP